MCAVYVSAGLLGDMHVSAKQDSVMVYRYMYVVTQSSFLVGDQQVEFKKRKEVDRTVPWYTDTCMVLLLSHHFR